MAPPTGAQKGETTMGKLNANKVGEITNYEEALEAVRKDGWALEYVPVNLRTAKVCLEALKSSWWISEKLETAKLYFEAVKNRIGKPLRKCRKPCGTKCAVGSKARSDTTE